MIENDQQYRKAEQELEVLMSRLKELQSTTTIGSKGFTKAGIRKLIARTHEELAIYESQSEARISRAS
ncbi:MAG: hypothetical protein ACK5E3_03025 [Planctomycetota bacterium]